MRQPWRPCRGSPDSIRREDRWQDGRCWWEWFGVVQLELEVEEVVKVVVDEVARVMKWVETGGPLGRDERGDWGG